MLRTLDSRLRGKDERDEVLQQAQEDNVSLVFVGSEDYYAFNMKNYSEVLPQQESKKDLEKRVMQAMKEIDAGAQGSLDTYVTMNYQDEEGRFAEVRLLRSFNDPKAFNLNANIGKPLALLSLKALLEKKGIQIDRLAAYDASPEEQEILKMNSREKR